MAFALNYHNNIHVHSTCIHSLLCCDSGWISAASMNVLTGLRVRLVEDASQTSRSRPTTFSSTPLDTMIYSIHTSKRPQTSLSVAYINIYSLEVRHVINPEMQFGTLITVVDCSKPTLYAVYVRTSYVYHRLVAVLMRPSYSNYTSSTVRNYSCGSVIFCTV